MSVSPRRMIFFCGTVFLLCGPCLAEQETKNPFDPCKVKDGHVNCFKFDFNLAKNTIVFKEPLAKSDIPKVIEDLKIIQEKAN